MRECRGGEERKTEKKSRVQWRMFVVAGGAMAPPKI